MVIRVVVAVTHWKKFSSSKQDKRQLETTLALLGSKSAALESLPRGRSPWRKAYGGRLRVCRTSHRRAERRGDDEPASFFGPFFERRGGEDESGWGRGAGRSEATADDEVQGWGGWHLLRCRIRCSVPERTAGSDAPRKKTHEALQLSGAPGVAHRAARSLPRWMPRLVTATPSAGANRDSLITNEQSTLH